jgi:hypothetical protein
MPLSIKDPTAEQLARALAERTGETIPKRREAPGDFRIDPEATIVGGEPPALIDRFLWQKVRSQYQGRFPLRLV